MSTQVDQGVRLNWDAFLEAEVERNKVPLHVKDAFLRQRNSGIRRFREVEWPQIRHQLAKDKGISLSDELEPHWTEAGRAVYWQHEIVSQIHQTGLSPLGTPIRALEEVDYGWKPTSPLPANSASIIADFLRNGLRLRPPTEVVQNEAVKAAVAADGSQRVETVAEPRQFECLRHGDVRRFVSWKTYLQHCAYNKEAPEEKAPDAVLEMAKKFTYFCFLHNKGFMFKRTAVHHLKNELRKPGRAVHPGLEQMTVNKGG